MSVLIKWTGSKRILSNSIINYFPNHINTYYEPFLGGGHLLYKLLSSSLKVNELVASDLCKPLIDIYQLVKITPNSLIDDYKEKWNKFQENGKFYYEVRDSFNANNNPYDLLFLSRTCYNGLIRFSKYGAFNSSCHFDRPGIHPNKLKEIIMDWHNKIQNVSFICRDFSLINSNEDDVIYCDPPYFHSKGVYFYEFNHNRLWDWAKIQKGKIFLSFDGERDGNKMLCPVPKDVFGNEILLPSSKSSFSRLKGSNISVQESLWVNK